MKSNRWAYVLQVVPKLQNRSVREFRSYVSYFVEAIESIESLDREDIFVVLHSFPSVPFVVMFPRCTPVIFE